MLNLYEHQSTLNPNMPIRGLEYFADIYRAYIVSNELNMYGTALVKLPTPMYVVFYNGDTETTDRFEYRLSDAFEGEGGCLEYCIEQDILKKYFLKHRSEVVHMFPADYDMRIYKRILKKDYERRLEEKDAEMAEKDTKIARLTRQLEEVGK